MVLVGGSRCSILLFLSHTPFQDVSDIIILSPIIMFEGHDSCRNIRYLFSPASSSFLKPDLMKYSIIRDACVC